MTKIDLTNFKLALLKEQELVTLEDGGFAKWIYEAIKSGITWDVIKATAGPAADSYGKAIKAEIENGGSVTNWKFKSIKIGLSF